MRVRFLRVHWVTDARLAAVRGCLRTFTEPHRARCSSPSLRVSTRCVRDSFSNDNNSDDNKNSRRTILSSVFGRFEKRASAFTLLHLTWRRAQQLSVADVHKIRSRDNWKRNKTDRLTERNCVLDCSKLRHAWSDCAILA